MNGFHFLMRKMKNSFEKVPFLLVPPNALGVWPPMPPKLWGVGKKMNKLSMETLKVQFKIVSYS